MNILGLERLSHASGVRAETEMPRDRRGVEKKKRDKIRNEGEKKGERKRKISRER